MIFYIETLKDQQKPSFLYMNKLLGKEMNRSIFNIIKKNKITRKNEITEHQLLNLITGNMEMKN